MPKGLNEAIEENMRVLSSTVISILTLLWCSNEVAAGQNAVSEPAKSDVVSQPENSMGVNADQQLYRNYLLDLSAVTKRKDFAAIENAMRRQIDIVEGVGLSPRVLDFFHKIPILVDEFACLNSGEATDVETKSDSKKPVLAAGCYYSSIAPELLPGNSSGFAIWDSKTSQWVRGDSQDVFHNTSAGETRPKLNLADYSYHGVVMFRLQGLEHPKAPVLLHEMLHAYHANIMPQGFEDQGIHFYYEQAQAIGHYPDGAYLMTNEKEFFAVTASVFLNGEAYQEPFTRSKLKERLPDYYHYLVWLFGFDPDGMPKASPVASVDGSLSKN